MEICVVAVPLESEDDVGFGVFTSDDGERAERRGVGASTRERQRDVAVDNRVVVDGEDGSALKAGEDLRTDAIHGGSGCP